MRSPSSYAFRKTDGSPLEAPFMTLDSIGWERINVESYRYDGQARPDHGHVIFQYTRSGCGVIELDRQRQLLPQGSAFLAKVPSMHAYYFDKSIDDHWEILWLNVKGEDALKLADRLLSRNGDARFALASESEVLRRYWTLYDAVQGGSTDPATLSVMVYQWLVQWLSEQVETETKSASSHPAVQQAKAYMSMHVRESIGLDDVAQAANVSKYHLCRLFSEEGEVSPLEFMRLRRMETAAKLLRTTAAPIKVIAAEVGFEHASYFSEVFRGYFGRSPMEYRDMVLRFPYEHIRWEESNR